MTIFPEEIILWNIKDSHRFFKYVNLAYAPIPQKNPFEDQH
jgi:hypothetical protein